MFWATSILCTRTTLGRSGSSEAPGQLRRRFTRARIAAHAAIISLVTALGAVAAAADHAFGEGAGIAHRYGAPAANGGGRTVTIHPSTKYVNVHYREVVTIQNDKGQRFAWQFATQMAPTGFALRQIAPPGFESGITWVYVDNSMPPVSD